MVIVQINYCYRGARADREKRYTDELAALCDPDCIAAVRQSGYAVGGYSDVEA